MSTEKTAAELATEIKSDFAKAHDAVKAIAEEALGKAKSNETLSTTLKEKADEALTKLSALNEQVSALEQKAARVPGQPERRKSFGEQFVEGDDFKAFMAAGGGKGKSATLHVKAALSSSTANADGAIGDAIRPDRLAGIDMLPKRRLTIRDLLTPGQTDSNAIEYVKQTGFNNNAAMVAEGSAKPQSDMKLDLVSIPVRVVAHTMKASKQVLSDIPGLRSTIDGELLYGLDFREEVQLLTGDGTGQNLTGIIPQATAYSAPITVSSPTSIDMLRLMALQAALAEYPASGIVMHPSDWAWVELLKDTTGRYIIGNPQGGIAPTLWGLPVVATQAITIDKVLVGAFNAAQLFDRWENRIEVGYENDDFTKNMVTILAEKRLALAVKRPEAFIYGDFGRVA